MSESRRRPIGHHRHPYSAAALGQDDPHRRPSLSSPSPPTPFVPSTPLPRANPSASVANHHYQPFQQRPSTATSTSSSNLSDTPSTRGMMKRLLAKLAPPSPPTAPFSFPSMRPGFHFEDDHEKEIAFSQDQDTAQEITVSSSLPINGLSTPRSPNEFDKSIRALDLVGQTDFSLPYFVTKRKKQRNVFRRSPSGTAITKPSVPTSGNFVFFSSVLPSVYPSLVEYRSGFRSLDDSASIPTPTPSTTTSSIPLHSQFSRRSFSPPTRHASSKKSSASQGSSPGQPKATHSHRTKAEQSPMTSDHTGLADNSGTAGDSFWDDRGRYRDKKREQRNGVESSRTLSGKRGKNDSNHQSRPSHESERLTSVDKDQAMVKKLPDVPAAGSPSRRFWKLVKKISVGGLREKHQADHDRDPPPPVPPLPSNIPNAPFYQHRTQSDSSLVNHALKKAVSKATLAPSPMTQVPSTAVQHHTESAPHFPPSTGPRPSTTSSDVASSSFFNHQSARSSTSSFDNEEAIPLPPLPKSLFSTLTPTSKTNRKPTGDDTNGSRRLPQHIVPPSELDRNHSSTNLPNVNPIAIPMPIRQSSLAMEDDWTIVRSPSIELEVSSLPPPPRQLFKGVGLGIDLDRRKITTGQGIKAKTTASDVFFEQVDEKNDDVSNDACSQEDEKDIIKEITTTKSEQGDKGKDVLESNTDRDSNRSQSPTIPSFSISSTINSFPARRVSSSFSTQSKGSPVAVSPNTSNMSSGSIFSTTNVLRSPSQSPQHPGSRTAFGRVRRLFGTDDVRVKADENEELDPLLSTLNSDIQASFPHPTRQEEHLGKLRKHHRSSSGGTTPKPKSTHTVSASSVSMPASPIAHSRSMSFNKSSPALPIFGFCPASTPFSDAPQSSSASSPHTTPLPPSPVAPSPPSRTGHRTRSFSNLRSGFSGKKLSEVFSSSMSLSMSPELTGSTTASRARAPSPPNHRTLGTLLSRSISVGASSRYKSNTTTNAVTPSQPRTRLTDQEKTDKWNDLLARSARAGGTLHLDAGSRLLGSDDI